MAFRNFKDSIHVDIRSLRTLSIGISTVISMGCTGLRDPSVPTNKHSLNVLDLLGEPVAKLNIPSIFKNLDRDYCDVILSQITCISEKGQIYLVEFESEDMIPFEYRGYSKVEQLGRFYSLTLNKKITRLYTSVGFLHQRNL